MFKSGRPRQILNVCKKMIRYIKKSGKNGKFSPSLKSPSNIRWNFALKMFNSLVEAKNWIILNEVLVASPKRKLLDRIDKEEIVDMIRFLTLFNRATKSMETTARPTIHNVLAWYDAIEKQVQLSGNESAIIKTAKENVESYFLLTTLEHSNFLTSVFHKMGIFLHPELKQMRKLSQDERQEVRHEVKLRCRQFINADDDEQLPAVHMDDNNQQMPNQNDSFDILANYMDIESAVVGLVNGDIETEMVLYDEVAVESVNVNILEGWSDHKMPFPRLAALARFVFAIPASSVAPERNFSTAG